MFGGTVRTRSIEGPRPRKWPAAAGIAALTGILLVAGMLLSPSRAYAVVTPVALASAGTYLVLGGTGVTNTGPTVLSGDLGVSPSTAIAGFPPGTAAGATHAGDSEAAQAQSDLLSAYNDAAARIPTADFAGDQNGNTFNPGVHHTAAAFALTGTMTLDGQGDPNAVFIFQIGAALNTAAASNITLINGAQASRVFWQVLGAAGTGASSSFSGTIMALGAITVGAGASITGRALSRGLVTLSTNTFTFTNTAPPVVAVTGGATASTNDAMPMITGTTSAAAGTTVTVSVAGQTLPTTVQGGGTWSVTAATLADGLHGVVARVTDPGGNIASASQTLTVDTVSPVVAIIGGATASANTATPTVTGTTDASAGTTVTVTLAGQTLNTTVQTGGTWSVTAATLASGLHGVVDQVTDPAGNTGTANQTLTVDTTIALVALATAATYSVLGGTGVTNTGLTVLGGDLGVSPATAIVGFPPGIAAGATHAGDPQAAQAQTDLLSAYNDAAGRIPTTSFAGDNNGRTFSAGIHHTAAAFALTGTMTLDGQGDPNAVFIFQIGAALNTAAASNITLINGAQASHVFWQVLGAAGTGASSSFSGTIMALGAITMGAGATFTGRALSRDLVTLSTNTFTFPGGVLGISAPAAKDLGSGAAAGTLTAQLGAVTATDNRGQPGAGWTAQASSTVFSNTTTPAAAPITTLTYASGLSTSTTGTAVFLPGQAVLAFPSALSSTAVTVFSASASGGNNSATWSPTIVVNLPAQAITGSYSGTITHSVS